jgi:hypothetical protein
MKQWNHGALLAAGLLLAGVASAATFDRGLIPKSTPSSDTSAGPQFTGDVAIVFEDYNPTLGTASAFQSTVRLRKGNEVHVFLYTYACALADPCGLCVVNGDIGTGDQVGIQMCIEDGIEPEVKADFALAPQVAVRLKDVTSPAAKFYPATSQLVFGANVEVSAK